MNLTEVEKQFNNLTEIEKKIINIYRSAKQFKNAIYLNEVLVLPKRIRMIPFIVNKAFSCELYLKCIICINSLKDPSRQHSLFKLYKECNIDESVESYFTEMNKVELEKEIKKISDTFIKFRYVYEYTPLEINCGFLNRLCDCLDRIAHTKVLKQCQIDMDNCFY